MNADYEKAGYDKAESSPSLAPALLVTGCTSDAGKSVVVAGMCRSLARRGYRVAPFKAQNMSNNSAVVLATDYSAGAGNSDSGEGAAHSASHHEAGRRLVAGEIGRAQALQAFAAGATPSVDMNPVLLKPEADRRSQLVLRGVATGTVGARDYIEHRTHLREVSVQALESLRREYDVVICEGAGSPAEINLRHTDIANMGLAEAADLPVVLVGDIDRGGVLAHFFGTYFILDPSDRDRFQGFIVNKFRGDVGILQPGLGEVTRRTGVPTLGVIPFVDGLWIDAEDSLSGASGRVGPGNPPIGTDTIRVAAVRLPRVSNSTDIEALSCEPGVDVEWTTSPAAIASADLVVIPGSKSTIHDLEWLTKTAGPQLQERYRAGRPILGICGGFQMLCHAITDPVESGHSEPVAGLDFLDIDIEFFPEKTLANHGTAFEIHHGRVVRQNCPGWIGPLPDGESSGDQVGSGEHVVSGNHAGGAARYEGAHEKAVWGTHRHGQLEVDSFRRQFLRDVAQTCGLSGFVPGHVSFHDARAEQVDRLADAVDAALGADWAERLGIATS
ncbi:cobyric acid synthase [Corynebacterium pseudokroppenstedtii]|uniref:Cobyric acid synthase n=1 Tax=Corynebacterium pseudokroppenstedtii TaxID=2804917 RepID=A0AAU0PVM2_9CORY|nr:cobyric acid synthase [Corynebacterium pseudokroppenstedtii]MCF6793615.1 cobyric acid synthase [Corynebacterium pseudokroppenstedtii]MCF8703848.1 cobyric acid synthase [Corynebacterium pseudokroppenstedtii]MCG2637355.1 cobyric acid synthase [Corynebacterium pseudokroppenstedtii]MDK7147473.1 cobyric acid synthase [Corynebacterium pseudokroppenstedtii]